MSDSHTDNAQVDAPETIVEHTLRSQRGAWATIAEKVAKMARHELPYEVPKRILIFGLGSSYFAARLCSYAIMRDRTRPRIPTIACSAMNLGEEIMPQQGDWAFGITHRGGSQPTVKALELCRRAGVFTVAVCGEGAKSIESAHITLTTVPQETVEPHTASMTGAICAITSLMMGPKCWEEWDALRSIGSPDLESLRKKVGKGPALILGEFEGEWVAREAGLKLMEMARVPVRVFGSEEFFHGPRFSYDESQGGIWHVSTPGDGRNAQIKSDYSISITGATPLAWMPALVEMQWAALAVALNRGVDPDLKS